MKGYVIIADIVTYLPSINVQNVNVPYTLTQKYNDVHEWNDICTHNGLRIPCYARVRMRKYNFINLSTITF